MTIKKDNLQKNIILNDMEFSQKKIKLNSTPQYITIGAHYGCNAKCKFCLGGNYPKFTLEIYREFFEKKLYNILKKAVHVGFCGYGEVLLRPDILIFLNYINKTLPDTTKVFTTNGIPLTDEICKKLTQGKYSVLISLHAANSKLHRMLTGISAYDDIIDNIKRLNDLKAQKKIQLHINLIFLLTTLNFKNLPEFIKLAVELGVERVTCNYLTIFSPAHIELSCYFKKQETKEIFDKSTELANKLGIKLVLPPRFGVKDKGKIKVTCRDPWEFFYVETQGSVLPCCYAGGHIGYLNKREFEEIWNSYGYSRLRKGLINCKPYEWCKYCSKYKPSNIDDIRSHITFRPDTQKKIIRYLKKREYKFSEIEAFPDYTASKR